MSMLARAISAVLGGGRQKTPVPDVVDQTVVLSERDVMAQIFGIGGGIAPLSEKTAMQVSAVYACVNLIAGAISTIPMRIYKCARDGHREEMLEDDLWWILNEEFCPRWAASAAWEFLVSSMLLHGDAFAEIKRDQFGRITGLIPVHPSRVAVGVYPDGSRLAYAIEPDPATPKVERRTLDQDDMIHVAGFGFDGVRGLSALQYNLAMTGGVAQATQEYAAKFFQNSARPDYALVFPANASSQSVSKEKLEFIKQQLEERHQGISKSHLPMLLTGGIDIKSITLPMKDIQFLEVRQFQIEEVARAFGVPPFMIGHTEKTTSWGSGVESMGTSFVRFTLNKHLEKFQTEINRKFFKTRGKVAVFDTFRLERADMKTLFESFRIAIGRAGEPGFMTPDEVRAIIGQCGISLSKEGVHAPEQAIQPAG